MGQTCLTCTLGGDRELHTSRFLLAAIAALGVICGAASPDPPLLLATFAVLGFGVYLFWPVTDAPLLLLAFGQQWLSVAIKPIETAVLRQPLDELSDFGGALTPAAWFGLAALMFLAVGMKLGIGRKRIDWSRTLALDAKAWPQKELILFALALLVAGHLLEYLSNYAGAARQIVLALGAARQAGLFMLAFWCLSNGRALGLLAAVVTLEIAFGLTGFFAGFRDTLLVFLIAAVAAKPRLSVVSIAGAVVGVAAMLSVSIFWSAIKPQYRDFLNEGVGGQVAAQPLGDRIAFVADAANHMDAERLRFGVTSLVARTSYIDFLAKTIEYVPTYRPHTNGSQIGQALVHILTPRILFPDKPPTPLDTAVTAEFTGLRMANDTGASISIGYVGEFYIDFGFIGSCLCTFAMGALGGLCLYLLRIRFEMSMMVNYGLAVAALLQFSLFETALIKFLGGAVTALIAALLLQRFILPRIAPLTRRSLAGTRRP
jgi:hypothetical protein